MSSSIGEFNFNICVWDSTTIAEVLKNVGFKSVQLLPYKVDLDFCGPYNLEKYIKLIDGNVFAATK